MSDASILIVEDETIVAEDLAMKLRHLGYTVAGTTDRGEEGLALTKERRPKLVLMDIRLAGTMDGIQAAERIRQECGVPVIYLTASSDRVTLDRAKRTEPFGYILKPFAERELETHVEMALYRHQVERKLRESAEALRQESEELSRKNEELERFNCAMVDRELSMIAMKKEVNELLEKAGLPAKYDVKFVEEKGKSHWSVVIGQ